MFELNWSRSKAEQHTIKRQNFELLEEASIAARGSATHAGTSVSLATNSSNAKGELNCLRICTETRPEETDSNVDAFTRYLPTDAANKHIRKALLSTSTTKDVQVIGAGTTKLGHVIRFRDDQSTELARVNMKWLEELGNGHQAGRITIGVVVRRTPIQNISLPGNKIECINKITGENDFALHGLRTRISRLAGRRRWEYGSARPERRNGGQQWNYSLDRDTLGTLNFSR
ncbi:uncharacterized protein Z518_06322 [Rhinocladiella mackenziei CBS 650.93]|uniref:Uncharacterized protein n=1 Tax=Rhinocladiella mackenziei CBS 650.93 TaxID=1442369 RepID=A0A0D2J8M3_9EURO|nr:uncharacterized protein Z518_06322 [Rhinocladiella mackenziei CBS 650.93]KIX05450.1 hypothetical protein Z518_06322 [Rhinocladiella mackenziei CBS 650.93]